MVMVATVVGRLVVGVIGAGRRIRRSLPWVLRSHRKFSQLTSAKDSQLLRGWLAVFAKVTVLSSPVTRRGSQLLRGNFSQLTSAKDLDSQRLRGWLAVFAKVTVLSSPVTRRVASRPRRSCESFAEVSCEKFPRRSCEPGAIELFTEVISEGVDSRLEVSLDVFTIWSLDWLVLKLMSCTP